MPTPRLPEVGHDDDNWGNILNEFLQVSHNDDGTQKTDSYVCIGFLNQTGTNDPVFTTIKDTILGTWSRVSTGTYTLTKTGAFVSNKTVPIDDVYIDQSGNLFKINRTSSDVMTLLTYAASDTSVLSDNVLVNRFINIEVFK